MHLNNISDKAAILPWVPNSGAVCVGEMNEIQHQVVSIHWGQHLVDERY